MKSLKTGIGLGVLLVCVLGCGHAFAQDREDYKARMAGAAAVMKTDVNEAFRQYLETRAIYAGADVDFGLGRAYQRLFQCEQAKYYFTQVMVAYDLPESNATFQRAVASFDEVSTCDGWQQLKLKCEIPAGGYVMIDNDRFSTCWDRPYSMPDGKHTFKIVDAEGHETTKVLTFESGKAPQQLTLAVAPEKVEAQTVEIERTYEVKERFSPALYWGLIAGGVAIAGVGGVFGALANSARADEQKWADYMGLYASHPDQYEMYKKKRDSANDDVKLNHTLMYSFIGVGAAVAVTGAALAIVSAVSGKERVESNPVSTYVMPGVDGLSMGLGVSF